MLNVSHFKFNFTTRSVTYLRPTTAVYCNIDYSTVNFSGFFLFIDQTSRGGSRHESDQPKSGQQSHTTVLTHIQLIESWLTSAPLTSL